MRVCQVKLLKHANSAMRRLVRAELKRGTSRRWQKQVENVHEHTDRLVEKVLAHAMVVQDLHHLASLVPDTPYRRDFPMRGKFKDHWRTWLRSVNYDSFVHKAIEAYGTPEWPARQEFLTGEKSGTRK